MMRAPPPLHPDAERMPHETGLIATLAIGFALAFACGLVAVRLRLPPLVGYLVAGVVVGTLGPGGGADPALAAQLAEVGVVLLMFGVGLHFSIRDLLAVRRSALPGAVAQIALTTTVGATLARLWGWPWGQGVVFGLCLAVASTVVLLRGLDARGTLTTVEGRLAVGWVIVEDVAMVLALVLLPAFAPVLGGTAPADAVVQPLWLALVLTLGKVAAFVALMLFVGARAVPWLLVRVARIGSRELFTLSVLAVALGVAFGAAALFGVSFALGAFFAGVVISESELSHQAAADALPFQDAFAVLFFVSVGMLFDPGVLAREPLAVLLTLLVVLLGKGTASLLLVLALRYPARVALAVATSLAQIGEFSFILAGLGVALGVLEPEARNLVLAASILSITVNPLLTRLAEPADRWLQRRPRLLERLERSSGALQELPASDAVPHDHAVIVGFGRVGGTIARALERQGTRYVAIEQDRELVEALRARGVPVLHGDAGRVGTLERAGLDRARVLIVATPGAYQARRVIELARALRPDLDVVVRTHSETEQSRLRDDGIAMAVVGERELALGMARHALRTLGATPEETDAVVQAVHDRNEDGGPVEAPSPGASQAPSASSAP
jgi:CPA2 family monovalent cation:H+ antiporter-2